MLELVLGNAKSRNVRKDFVFIFIRQDVILFFLQTINFIHQYFFCSWWLIWREENDWERDKLIMCCCQNIKAHVGYTQEHEWYVAMVSNDRIVCECHSQSADFHMKPPFSLEQWQERWKQCEEKFFHGQNVLVEWEQHVWDVLSTKTSKLMKGKVYYRIQ